MSTVLDPLPESAQIDDLLQELAPLNVAIPTMPAFPSATLPAPPSVRRWSPGSLPTGVFLRQVNWTNQADYEPPRPSWLVDDETASLPGPKLPAEQVPLCPGAVPLRQFLHLVNWANADASPALPTFEAPGYARAAAGGQVVESFFETFGF